MHESFADIAASTYVIRRDQHQVAIEPYAGSGDLRQHLVPVLAKLMLGEPTNGVEPIVLGPAEFADSPYPPHDGASVRRG